MRRYIFTGAPGAGKTTLLRYLEQSGCAIVEEAATDVIALEQQSGVLEPWTDPSFVEKILTLQKQRQNQPVPLPATVQLFDRAPLDTLALCRYLGYPVSDCLLQDIMETQEAGGYERTVFFIENLGYCEPTAARRITFEESLSFEKIHEETYREGGYECLKIPLLSVPERAQILLAHIFRRGGGDR